MSMAGCQVINASGSGDNELIAAPPANQFIRVLHYHLTSKAAVDVKLYSAASASGNLLDVCYGTSVPGGGVSVSSFQDGVLDCNPGQALIMNLSTGASVGGAIRYTIKGGP